MRTLALLSLLATAVVTVAAQDTNYAVTVDDFRYLHLLTSSNAFDSIGVTHACGEFAISGSTGTRRIYPNTPLVGDSVMQNSGSQGAQTSLRSALKTEVFYIASTDLTIRFYRELTANPFSPIVNRATSSWKFDDTTEFVIQLVRASDDAVLMTLDSVGCLSTSTNSTARPMYGTSWNYWCRTITLPSGVKSCSTYIRVEPRRWGTTPAGMIGYTMAFPYSRFTMSTCGTFLISVAANEALRTERFSRLVDLMDAYYEEFCLLPRLDHVDLLYGEGEFIKDRYMYITNITSGDTTWKVNPCEAKASANARIKTRDAGVHITNVAAKDGILRTSVSSPIESDIEISVYDLGGRLMGRPVPGRIQRGENQLSSAFPGKSGTYLVILRAPDGSFHVARKLISL